MPSKHLGDVTEAPHVENLLVQAAVEHFNLQFHSRWVIWSTPNWMRSSVMQ